jgi:predicted transcriptional regulator
MSDPITKSIFDSAPDEALEAALDAEADADFDAGRIVPHSDVIAWLESWGRSDEQPSPILPVA